jgi:hypothetical protein
MTEPDLDIFNVIQMGANHVIARCHLESAVVVVLAQPLGFDLGKASNLAAGTNLRVN